MLGADYQDLDAVVRQWSQNIQEVDALLSGYLEDADDTMTQNYLGWKANADYFLELSGKATQSVSVWADWKRVGKNILQHGRDLAQLMADSTVVGRIEYFISTFPDALGYVAKTMAYTAVNAVNAIIPWYVWAGAIGLGGLLFLSKTRKSG
jgi:hypothetical protein